MIKTYKGIEYLVFKHTSMHIWHYYGYVRLPADHPFAPLTKKKRYMDLGMSLWEIKGKKEGKPKPKPHRRIIYNGYDSIPLEAHGGLTFSRWIPDDKNPIGFTPGPWIGWDYAHVGDYLHETLSITHYPLLSGEHDWTEKEVEAECHAVIDQVLTTYHKS